MTQDEAEVQEMKGRAAVRALLIEPLQAYGLQRGKGLSVDQHQAFLDRLAEKLAYLDPAMLLTLREVTLSLAEGARHDRWPSFAVIWGVAIRLRQPPDNERHIMNSWLVSRAGPAAREGGYLVELHSWLRRYGRPPGDFDMREIVQRAADNAQRRERIAERLVAGRAQPDDMEWHAAYARQLAYCTALVEDGEAARAAKQQDIQQGAA